jgi:hypothetical protein
MSEDAEVIEKPKSRKAGKTANSGKTQRKKRATAQLKPYMFKPGQSGNIAGPKPGYRHEFSRAFVSCLAQDFSEHGPQAVVKVREENPLGYLRVCASLVEQEVNIKTPFSHLDHMSDDQLRASIEELNERVLLALAGHSGTGGAVSRAAAPDEPKQAGGLQTVLKAT